MKTVLALSVLFLSLALSAQNADSLKIKASDPTQIYTFVEGYTGLIGFEPDWMIGLRGNFGINKFRLGFNLPTSSNSEHIFDDIRIDFGYQLHNNSGIYNATVIGAGASIGSYDDIYAGLYLNSSGFDYIFVNYLGAIKFHENFAFYPGIEWFKGSNQTQQSFRMVDSSWTNPSVYTTGFKFSASISCDINAKQFLQLNTKWSIADWEGKYAKLEVLNELYSSITESRVYVDLVYQYAFTPFAQVYLKLIYSQMNIERTAPSYFNIIDTPGGTNGFQLGFTYFLH